MPAFKKIVNGSKKANLVDWVDWEHPGVRINWLNAVTWLLGIASAVVFVHQADADRHLFTASSWIGMFVLVIFAMYFVGLYLLRKHTKETYQLIMAVALGFVLGMGTAILLYFSRHVFGHVLIGAAVLMVAIGLFAANSLTLWWPHFANAENRSAS